MLNCINHISIDLDIISTTFSISFPRLNTEFGVPVINILWTIVAGRRFQFEDPQVQRMMNLLNRNVTSSVDTDH